jgi:hypothetical protein
MASPPISHLPIALFPLKLETRFVAQQLWIRAFPDAVFLQSHDPRLTAEERAAAIAFKNLSTETEKRAAWEDLVHKYGAYRAAWLAHISAEEAAQQAQQAAQSGERPEDEETAFFLKWLPDRLVFSLYRAGERQHAYEVKGATIDRAGLTLLGEQDDWLSDFDEAVRVGMGVKIFFPQPETAFERIIVSGLRYAENPLVPAKGLADLFANHQYTTGFSFLEYGTPTNNTATAKSGYSARDVFDAANSFDYTVNGFDLETDERMAGRKLARGLGLDPSELKHVRQAGSKTPQLNELFQEATWFALGAQPLFMLFGEHISSELHQEIWAHYAQFVKARGRYAALKVGDQPYGVLPVMHIRKSLANDLKGKGLKIRNSEQLFDKMWVLFALLLERWTQMAENNTTLVPRLGDEEDTYLEILKILSMQEASTNWRIRPLEYTRLREKLHQWLQHAAIAGPAPADNWLQPGAPLQQALVNIRKNITSFKGLFENVQISGGSAIDLTEKFKIDADALLANPLMGLMEADAYLIGFQDGEAALIDQAGEALLDDEGQPIAPKASFSFADGNLAPLQAFIAQLRDGVDANWFEFQYQGEPDLFCDLLLRSYAHALQLYCRDIACELTPSELNGTLSLSIGTVFKSAGETVAKGDTVLEINRSTGQAALPPVPIKAPFDGVIERLYMEAEATTTPGQRLFAIKDEAKYQNIKLRFIQLGQQIVDECQAIQDVEARKQAQTVALRETLDLNSFRLDAWITALADRQIEQIRNEAAYENGIYFGAYGWIEHLKRDESQLVEVTGPIQNPERLSVKYAGEGGIIHAPGPAQAVASAIFKNAFLSHQDESEASNPFALHLVSDRLQKSAFLLDGIRQGQQLEALLGYQLERSLHEHPNGGLNTAIYVLREAFPLYQNATAATGQPAGFVNLSVIDGLKAIEHKDNLPPGIAGNANRAAVKAYIEELEDVLDGSMDTLFYEAGYQVTQGNLSHAAAALDAAKGEIEPPEIESLKTRIPGTSLSHQLAIVFPAAPNSYPLHAGRAFAEPTLEKWLERCFGDFQKIGCIVELSNATDGQALGTAAVKLSDLNIGCLDLLHLCQERLSDGASELELRIWRHIVAQRGELPSEIQYRITSIAPDGCQALADALETARYARALLNRCRPLQSADLALEGEAARYQREALDDIKETRFAPLLQYLQSADLSQASTLEFLARLDSEEIKMALWGKSDLETENLEQAIGEKIAALGQALAEYEDTSAFPAAFNCLGRAAKILFGPDFLLLPPCWPSEQFATLLNADDRQHLLVGTPTAGAGGQVWGQARIHAWMQGLAQVHENTEAFEDWTMVAAAWAQRMNLPNDWTYRVVQGPTFWQYPWTALSKAEIDALLSAHYQPQDIFQHAATGSRYPLPDGSYYPDGCESKVFYLPPGFAIQVETPAYGLVVDEFSEHIPNPKVDTGLSFHYNAPNSEPPQAILLAVHPNAMETGSALWEEADLRDILFDTMDLYKVRMVDLDAVQEYGYLLPMTYWLNIPRS